MRLFKNGAPDMRVDATAREFLNSFLYVGARAVKRAPIEHTHTHSHTNFLSSAPPPYSGNPDTARERFVSAPPNDRSSVHS